MSDNKNRSSFAVVAILIIWSLVTLLLTVSVIGIILVVISDVDWFEIPNKCLDAVS